MACFSFRLSSYRSLDTQRCIPDISVEYFIYLIGKVLMTLHLLPTYKVYMKMKALLITSIFLLLAGCAGAVQNGSTQMAHDFYNDGEYELAVKYADNAERARRTTPALKAELTYIKAQSYEAMGYYDKAEALYEYLSEQHPKSDYGYLAAKRLSESNKTN